MIKKIMAIAGVSIMASACSLGQNSNNITQIYTTTYPVTYLVETLYGTDTEIKSIYPADANVEEYSLTSKTTKEYADSDLFVYNGLTTEKNTAKDFVNENGDILLIDVAYSLKIDGSIEELWLSPNNYLMLAQNIKDNLVEYNTYNDQQFNNDEIIENYNELDETLSFMDADLRLIGEQANKNSNNVLVVQSDAFLFLENYGFKIISLENALNTTDDAIKSIETNLENDKYLGIIKELNSENELINALAEDFDSKTISINTMYSAASEDDYMSIMNEFIFNLQSIVEN